MVSCLVSIRHLSKLLRKKKFKTPSLWTVISRFNFLQGWLVMVIIMIDDSQKRNQSLSFVLQSSHVIEWCNKLQASKSLPKPGVFDLYGRTVVMYCVKGSSTFPLLKPVQKKRWRNQCSSKVTFAATPLNVINQACGVRRNWIRP